MSEEPSLPPLPGVCWDERSQSFTHNPRKRVRNSSSAQTPSSNCNSSDPAVFSSDDDPALDNYVEGRRKKRYVGSWFQQQPTSSDSTFSEVLQPAKQRRAWTRQADSGVFLGSDGNESEDMLDHLEARPQPRMPLLGRPVTRQVSKAELAAQAARDKVRACLDHGQETVDFWSMGLEHLPNDVLAPLAQFERIPVVAKDVAFEQKDPELKIYLAMNRLMRVPGTLFDLTYLTTLSLRGNKLQELPPAICKLQHLQELNVSQNRLRHVPVELLELLKAGSSLHTLALHPNPFLQPDGDASEGYAAGAIVYRYAEGTASDQTPRLVSRSLGRSPSQLRNTSGRVLSEFRLPTSLSTRKIPMASSSDIEGTATARPSAPSSTPSLLEVALRTCYRSAHLPDMEGYIPDGLAHLRQLLEQAVRQKESGGLSCSRCKKLVVVPVVEWVEWQDLRTCERVTSDGGVRVLPLSTAKGERAVPFLHRGCSTRCGPVGGEIEGWGVPEGYEAPVAVEEMGAEG